MSNLYNDNYKAKRLKEKTFKEFLHKHLADNLEDIANHGTDAGYAYLTYTVDTVLLFDKYGDEIWDLAQEESESLGYKNVAEMIAGFRRADMLYSLDTFKNLMVWYAAETYARQYVDEKDNKTV